MMEVTVDVSSHLIEAMRNTHRTPEAQSRSGLTPRGGLTDQELAETRCRELDFGELSRAVEGLVAHLVYRYLSPAYWSHKRMEQLVGSAEEES